MRWRFIRASGGSVVAGALLAAPFLIPFAEAVRKSQRFSALAGAPHPAGILADWASTIATLQPHFFGFVPYEQPWGPAIPEAITGFAGTFAIAGAIALFAHVAATRAWRSREAFVLVALLISIGVIYSWPGIIQIFNLVFRLAPPARMRCLFALLTSICAAAAVDLLERNIRRPVLIGIFGASLLLLAMTTFPFPTPSHRDTAMLALLPAVAVLAAATAATRWRAAILVLMLVVIAEHSLVFGGWNAVLPASKLYPPTPLIRELMRLKAAAPKNAPFRIAGYNADFFPNLSTMYGLEDIRAHDPMESARYVGMLALVAGYNTSSYFAMWPNTTTTLLDYLNVRYFVTGPGRELDRPRFTQIYDGADGRIFENHNVLPRFYATRNVAVEWDMKRFVPRLAATTDWAHVAVLENLPITDEKMRADLIAPHGGPDASVVITSATVRRVLDARRRAAPHAHRQQHPVVAGLAHSRGRQEHRAAPHQRRVPRISPSAGRSRRPRLVRAVVVPHRRRAFAADDDRARVRRMEAIQSVSRHHGITARIAVKLSLSHNPHRRK